MHLIEHWLKIVVMIIHGFFFPKFFLSSPYIISFGIENTFFSQSIVRTLKSYYRIVNIFFWYKFC